MIEKRWSRAGAAWMREVRIADTTTAASRSCLRERQTKSTKGSGVFDFKSPAKSQRPRPGLICLGPGGTKPWLDLFEGLESIVYRFLTKHPQPPALTLLGPKGHAHDSRPGLRACLVSPFQG
jgi:hypothetical protein